MAPNQHQPHSPYSLKMRAVLCYRRIPFQWVLRNSEWDDLPTPPVPIIPVLAFPDNDGNDVEVMADYQPPELDGSGPTAASNTIPTPWCGPSPPGPWSPATTWPPSCPRPSPQRRPDE